MNLDVLAAGYEQSSAMNSLVHKCTYHSPKPIDWKIQSAPTAISAILHQITSSFLLHCQSFNTSLSISLLMQQPTESLCMRFSLISAQCVHTLLMLQCQVFNLLLAAQGRTKVKLPDPTAILPYLGLFSLVVLNPNDLTDYELLTTHLLGLSILHNGHFTPTPNEMSD